MANSVRETDNGHKALLKRIENSRVTLTVGIHEAEGGASEGDGDLTVLDVANIHEFGAPAAGIERRSMIADWSDEAEERNLADLQKVGEAVVKGSLPSFSNGIDRLGLKFVGDVQVRMREGIPPELADSTVAAKGSSTPLIDTGQLLTSIRHQVHEE